MSLSVDFTITRTRRRGHHLHFTLPHEAWHKRHVEGHVKQPTAEPNKYSVYAWNGAQLAIAGITELLQSDRSYKVYPDEAAFGAKFIEAVQSARHIIASYDILQPRCTTHYSRYTTFAAVTRLLIICCVFFTIKQLP